ncbi:PilW family protein [Variovorax sp. NFACC27]|uniref:PulJ/GspJ family protein n=1 Tax=unclassified Variovorax TaxID=663243 RepID=UPI000897AC11|nr:type IV pilus assembly protein PilW [Variovorax sp. NFACC28]SEG02312.1 type IV pilus assembly protein PilW [Variovorax sp. NFACC29]SFB97517.1 type IV pilus assembly protein PilW [Variovorax sp. NFACC26]SFF80222.1 type IV pilus assembly protein PilW [Variovorax sp. NFACC27]
MKTRACRSRGLTLVELLVAIALGLLLVAAAGYLLVSTTRVSRAVDANAQQQEAASVVLDIIGRDLKNAGFYPASFPVSVESSRFQGTYSNVVSTSVEAFDQGIFGCSEGLFDVANGTCPASKSTEPDSLVVNYFSADNFEVEGVGTRKDCLRQDVELAEFNGARYNEARAGSGAKGTGTVALPLFISNVYGLGASYTYKQDGRSISTRSFRCAGNGPNTKPHQPIVSGVTQLRFRYGVSEADTLEAPARFFTAAEVGGLPVATINGERKTAWQRVVAVQVCVVTKTLDATVRQTSSGSYVDCDGASVAFADSDRAVYKQQTRIFGVRNNLTRTF